MLTLSLLSPLVAGLFILLLPAKLTGQKKPSSLLMLVALAGSLISLAASLVVAAGFDGSLDGYQSVEVWFPSAANRVGWSFGVDGISIGLYILTTVLFPLGLYYSYLSFELQASEGHAPNREKLFWFSLLLLETSVIGVFVARNLIVFYIFWELILLPMILLIGIWGGKEKQYASIKFFIYTFAGSVFLILAMVAVVHYNMRSTLSFDINDTLSVAVRNMPLELQKYMFWAFIVSFLIKIPAFPLHTWLPHAHTQAPTVGSIILAGVLLKMGTYGIFRFSLPMFKNISLIYANFFIWLGVIGIIYGAWMAWAQSDIKKLIAYSSVSHMGYILAGMFSGTEAGLNGAYMQMINHGISTGLLFLLVGVIYDRTHTRELADYGGLAKLSPAFAVVFMIATLSSVGLPGTNGFVGEFLILLGTFQKNVWAGIFAITGVIFGAVYMLHLYKKMFFGEVSAKLKAVSEKTSLKISKRELAVVLPFVVAIFALGFKPEIVMDPTKKSLKQFVTNRTSLPIVKFEE